MLPLWSLSLLNPFPVDTPLSPPLSPSFMQPLLYSSSHCTTSSLSFIYTFYPFRSQQIHPKDKKQEAHMCVLTERRWEDDSKVNIHLLFTDKLYYIV